ncbi:MAG TPA: DUF177 domain-containing protein [Methylomirabilota bacterium]|nr:DUF177 domain-containing protein [Methylomirabilota bacterium]
MVIRVSEIPEEGLRIEGVEAFPRPFEDPAWRLERLEFFVEKDGDTVFVTGGFCARVPLACGRCLEALEVTVEPEVETRFVPAPSGRGEERELGQDDLETDEYEHDLLDLTTLLETEATLALPMKPLCREACRGLCPVCGGNRNVTACACVERVPDPRWAPLRALAERLSPK